MGEVIYRFLHGFQRVLAAEMNLTNFLSDSHVKQKKKRKESCPEIKATERNSRKG